MFQQICDTKKEPYVMLNSSECFEINTSSFLSKFVTWLVLRKLNDFNQNVLTFTAWEIDNRTKSI